MKPAGKIKHRGKMKSQRKKMFFDKTKFVRKIKTFEKN